MLIYHLSDSLGWYYSSIFRTKREAIETAERLMNSLAWKTTESITIHRWDTKTLNVHDVAMTIHGAHRAETHDL